LNVPDSLVGIKRLRVSIDVVHDNWMVDGTNRTLATSAVDAHHS